MTEKQEHLKTLDEIKNMMENSSRFLSLSGLSGVFAGIFALLGAAAAYIHLNLHFLSSDYYKYGIEKYSNHIRTLDIDFLLFFFIDALTVLFLALAFGTLFTTRNARKKGLKIWSKATKLMLMNLFVPLVAGGIFCLILVYQGFIELVAPATLIFYGLALINGGKYTYKDVRFLGAFEILIGLLASIFVGYGLLFWALGFGVMHIIYGVVMYFKYER